MDLDSHSQPSFQESIMRATLFGLGAFLFLAYPLFLLVAVARNIDQPQKKPANAAITLTPRSSNQLLARDSVQRNRGALRNIALRKSGN